MAASSVCSEHKSRVIEPRNIQIAGAFVFMSTGAVPERQMPSAMVRPGSKSRANVRKGSLGTWEILLSPLLLNQKRDDTGRTTTWHTRPDLAAAKGQMGIIGSLGVQHVITPRCAKTLFRGPKWHNKSTSA